MESEAIDNQKVEATKKARDVSTGLEMNEYSDLDLFLQGVENEETETVIYVYKIPERKNGVKDYCAKLVGEEPNLDEIRDKYGPGKYNFIVHVGKAKGKSFNIGISQDMTKAPINTPVNAASNIKEVIESIKPILELMRPAPAPAPSQSALMGDMMKEAAGVMGQGLREMMNQSVKASTDMMKRAREYALPAPEPIYEDDQTDEGETDEKSDMVQLIESFKDFLPYLTGGVPNGMKKKIVNDPRYVETIRSPEKLEKAKEIIMRLAPEAGQAIIDSLGLDKQPTT